MSRRTLVHPLRVCRGPVPFCAILAVIALWALVTTAGKNPVLAQDATPAAEPAAAAATVDTSDISANDVNVVAEELWCPLCSGVRLDSCELKACDQMKDVIAIKLAEGESIQSIIDYFVAQYGPQVLGRPPFAGWNLLAWILPVVVVVGGAAFLIVRSRSVVRGAPAALPDAPMPPAGEYDRKLDEELKRYD